MDAVAVLRQQAGQTGLAQVPAQHPEIQFTFHGVSLHFFAGSVYDGGEKGVPGPESGCQGPLAGKVKNAERGAAFSVGFPGDFLCNAGVSCYNILSIGMDRSKIFRHPRGRDRSPAEARCVFVLKSIGDQHLRAVSILPRPPVWRSAFFRRGGHYHPTDGEAQEITETMKAADQMTWSGKMNNIRAGAMDVVDKEIIYT